MPSVDVTSLAAEHAKVLVQLKESYATIEAFRKQNAELREIIKHQARDIALLKANFEKLLGGRAPGVPEIDAAQLTMFDGVGPPEPEEIEVPDHVGEAPDGETPDDKIRNRDKPKNRATRADLSNLPRDIVEHELPEEERFCPATGVPLIPIGVKVTEELTMTAAEIRVIEHRQVEYGPAPEIAAERTIKALRAPLPPQAVEGVMASALLLAQLLTQKYQFHMPLYRQESAFQQAGLRIPRQTLCDWVLKAAFELSPLARAIEESIRAGRVLQLDDTPVKCQAGKGQGNFQAYLWTFINPEVAAVAFRFTEGRSADDLAPLLKGAGASTVLGDAYAANRAAARKAGMDFNYAGCWAHVLRKYKDAAKEAPSMVRLFRDDFRQLYDIEQEATEKKLTGPARAAFRMEHGREIVIRIFRRTSGWKELFSLSGKMGDAMKYLRNCRRSLTRFLRDGDVPIDNNACERSIRPVAVGRRNWMFAGSVRGGEAAAIIYTLIESCKMNGVEPRGYLADVLQRLGSHPADRILELTPSEWNRFRGPVETA